MEEDLIAMFSRISTSDHEALVRQFSQILKTDENVARFFLEAGGWSVERAVHAYLSEFSDEVAGQATGMSSQPVVTFLSDLSGLQSVVFPPNHVVEMQWTFRNDGHEVWPEHTRIVWVDGERMGGTLQFDLSAQVHPAQLVQVVQRLTTPSRAGTFAGTWRLVCPQGYFGDPVWIILAVGDGSNGGNGNGREDAEMEML